MKLKLNQFKKLSKRKLTLSLTISLVQMSIMTPLYGGQNSEDEHFDSDGTNTDVIYGKDNRYESSEYPDRLFRDKAKSVAGMVRTRSMRPDYAGDPDNFTTFTKRSASRVYDVCRDEKYATQNVLPICSGFLVAPDLLVTAGHCVSEDTPCESYSWVFDYTEGKNSIPNSDIYKCKEVVKTQLSQTYYHLEDYAIIKLDRAVEGREALEFRKKGKPRWGTDLLIIGHPFGLPQKIADGAEVKAGNLLGIFTPVRTYLRKQDYFIANLDSFAGNSGSPVFNAKTGLVEGILIEGADDFIFDEENQCERSRVLKNNSNSSEERVYRINQIDYLKNL